MQKCVRLGIALAVLASLAHSTPAAAQGTASGPGLPPIIDRELFFGDPEVAGAQLSPDGQFLSFLKPFRGTRNIWVKRVDEPFDRARPLTADTKRPISQYFWSHDAKYVLFAQDQGGDENFNVYAVSPTAAPAAGQEVPAARNLTQATGVRTVIYAVPRTEPDLLYIGLNDRDKAWHDLYQVRISTGEKVKLRDNTDRFTGWVFDTKDQLRLATRSADNGDTEILRVDPQGFTKIYSCGVFETCGPVRFHKDGGRVYLLTNKGDGVDLLRLVLFDVQSGKEELVESDPLDRVDLGQAAFSDVTNELIFTAYQDDRTRVYFRDKAFEADYRLLEKQLPGQELGLRSPTRDERLFIVSAGSDVEPGAVYLFDRQARKLTLQYRLREKIDRSHLAPMAAIRYRSSDGLEIPAFLTLPKGVEPKNLPAIVFPHGGPWARDAWGYDSFAQFLANRGYAVLQPNFRGSTGYGKKFLDAGNNQWGEKMQDDLTWGVRYLVEKGIADSKRVGIMGGSYGGYATLAGVAFTPDVYGAAVSIVGPSNLITLLDSIPPYWEAARKLFHQRMGDPTTPQGKAQLERQSPLNAAEKIKTPLLVIQGANDPRVKKAESDQVVIALRDRGFPVEYLVASDEGHGFAHPVNNMAAYAGAERFLARHLGGRFQESMTPESAARLKEITVDPKTVVLPTRVDASSVGVPRPAVDLTPRVAEYKNKVDMGGRSVEMAVVSEIREEGGAWVILDTVKSPMGEATDRTVVEKGTLVLKKRSIAQGPVSIEISVSGDKATGEMKMGGQARPIDVALGGALFADGAGANDVLAALPLADGFTTSFRNLDLQAQKVTVKQLRVVGSEQATVPAGTFDTFKVEIASDDGGRTTLWIAKDSRRVVRASATTPRLNGATMTAELQKP